jgi:prolyl oligopeptidase
MRAEWTPWLERGYVMATCHVRGGGEYGQPWYDAGKILTKPYTWKDLIGCAEHLIRNGVTTPQKLGIMGWSAGGITVGRALTERPDLFAACRPGVRYPGVILPHGATDQRVAVWHSSKMAAALQTANPKVPVLLNIDFDAGHGRGSSTAQRLGTFADSVAFMLWQFGEPGFGLR